MPVYEVDDARDARLDDFRDLTDRAFREKRESTHGMYIAETFKVIERAIEAGHIPRRIMTQPRWLAGIQRLVSPEAPVFVVPDAVAESVAGYAIHRGALAAMERPALPSVTTVLTGARTVLVLDDVTDHTNVGAAFRAAAALGADAVLVSPGTGDPLYRRSVRVSMGGVFQLPWTRFDSWAGLAADLRATGITSLALALRPDAIPLDDASLHSYERVALVMGAEGAGLSEQAIAACEHSVVIPMFGGVDSLNVASAAAVALWELRRRTPA